MNYKIIKKFFICLVFFCLLVDFYLSKGGQNAKNKKIAISSKLDTKNN